MVKGTVKFFNRKNNYGFIDGDDGKSYFVHATGLKPGTEIDEGDKVDFKAVSGDKGPKAEDVKLIGKAESEDEGEAEEAGESDEEPEEESEDIKESE